MFWENFITGYKALACSEAHDNIIRPQTSPTHSKHYTVDLIYLWFHFPSVSVNFGQSPSVNIKGKFQKQFICSKVHIVLSSMLKSCTLPSHPIHNMNSPFVEHIHTIYAICPLVQEKTVYIGFGTIQFQAFPGVLECITHG